MFTEQLEARRYFSLPTFDPAVETQLPVGFQVGQVLQGETKSGSGLIVTGKTGGGLWLTPQADGTYTIAQLMTSGTVFGSGLIFASPSSSDKVFALFTSQGLMIQQPDGSFAAPSGPAVPTDTVIGSAVIEDFNNNKSPDLAVETFAPNAGDPSHGTLGVALFPSGYSAFLPEQDTVLASNFPASQIGAALVTADFNRDANADIIAGGQVFFGDGAGGFTPGPSLNLPPSLVGSSIYADSVQGHPSIDLLMYPAPSTAPDGSAVDSALILLNEGHGAFTPGDHVTLGPAGSTGGNLILGTLASMTPENFPEILTDIAANVVEGDGSPGVAFAFNIGNGTFTSPIDVATPGRALGFFEGENGNAFLICTASNGAVGALEQDSILSSQVTTSFGAVVQLSTDANPAVAGDPVLLTAAASDSIAPGYTSTSAQEGFGQMYFFDGTELLGKVDLESDGIARLLTNSLSAGTHVIHASYVPQAGPSVGAGVSQTLVQTVNAGPAQMPHVTVGSMSLRLPGAPATDYTDVDPAYTVIPRDKGKLQLTLTNTGGMSASGNVAVQLYATRTGSVDSSAVPISVPSLASHSVHLAAGGTTIVNAAFSIPDELPAGTYYITARAAALPDSTLSAQDISDLPAIASSPVKVVWSFGVVGSRTNVKLVRHLSSGAIVTYRLTGGDTGNVVDGGPLTLSNGGVDSTVTITGSDPTSGLTITQTGSTSSNIVALSSVAGLASVDMRQDTPNSITSDHVDHLMLGSIPIAHPNPGVSGYPADVPGNVNLMNPAMSISADHVNGSIVLGNTLGKKALTTMNIGALDAGCDVQLSNAIGKLRIGTAVRGSTLSAPSIASLISSGDFDANLTVTGTTTGATVLGKVAVGGSVGGAARWVVNGNIGKVKIAGDVTGLDILGGASVGPQGSLVSPPASFSATAVQSLTIGGSVSSSIIAAGLDPVDGVLLDGDDRLLPGGSIRSITVGGLLSEDSKILAGSVPVFANVDKSRLQTANDPRFQLPG